MIQRCFDAQRVNRWVARDGTTQDFSEFLAFDLNVCLIEGQGGAVFAWRGPGIYEVHVFFEQRGREVLDLSRRMLDHMRRYYGARYFWTAIPALSRHVIMFARLLGWKSKGCAEFPHGVCQIFVSENLPCLQQ